jgi:hypothetical protein
MKLRGETNPPDPRKPRRELSEPERITKIDAAQRQLCTAIRLFFE